MTIDATDSSKERMDCARVAREEILEGYLLGRLPEDDRAAFEEHYFECEHCFEELRTVRAAREELARLGDEADSRTHTFFGWKAVAGFAAAAILIIGLGLSLREPSSPPPETTARTSSVPQPEPTKTQAPEAKDLPEPTIEQLARVEPARYEPNTLRGPVDEASQRFRRGMERYQDADYMKAADDLHGALKLDPDAPHISFFLGVCQLMSGNDAPAIDSLRATIALGDSPYLEDAHFYLAKAFLRRKDLEAATAELQQVIAVGGPRARTSDGRALKQVNPTPRSEEASRLLAEIERLKK
jgi:tetratricopeptide (TPR) repeat protein